MMMLLAISVALMTGLMVYLVLGLMPGRERVVRDRLSDIQALGTDPSSPVERRRRFIQGDRVLAFLEHLGARLRPNHNDGSKDTELLTHAGYRSAAAMPIYVGTRLILGLGTAAVLVVLLPAMGLPSRVILFIAVYFGAIGYLAPLLHVRARRRRRQKELQLALPDALDLLVVCVEAGLGLNQALVRVAEEIRHVSILMSTELLQTNSEIRAGTPRDQALRQLADRTGVEDISSLTTMLIQTDRFGTSIARSLRVHSDTMRQKRRQRAEEAAAKTAIKMVFPLVFCIFPAMFVVILGPGMIKIARALTGLT